MKLGLQLGYWGRGPVPNTLETVLAAEAMGYDSLWTAEAWGSDALTPLAWYGAHTTTLKLGQGITQLSARTPTATAAFNNFTPLPTLFPKYLPGFVIDSPTSAFAAK